MFRGIIAHALNRSRRVCWTDLACWMSFPETRLRDELTTDTTSCAEDARKHGTCYCGKFCTAACRDQVRGRVIVVEERG